MDLTAGQPMTYKSCRDFVRSVRTGDFLELRLPNQRSPIYLPTAAVQDGSIALIVVYEKSKGQPGVWLHYFDQLAYPQVAAVDVSGGAASPLDLACVSGSCSIGKHEQVAASSVVPMEPGTYSVKAGGAPIELSAAPSGCYAVLLTGKGEAVIYPPSAALAYSGAAGPWALSALLVTIAAAAF